MKATTIKPSASRIGLWAALFALVVFASAGCAGGALPAQDGQSRSGARGESQDAPPTRTAEVIRVDLGVDDPKAVAPDAGAQGGLNRRSDVHCPALRGPLLQVVSSENPVREAQALGLVVREEAVQTTLILDRPGAAFLERAGITIGAEDGTQIQAFVPIARLCELSAHSRVLDIRPVAQAETQ